MSNRKGHASARRDRAKRNPKTEQPSQSRPQQWQPSRGRRRRSLFCFLCGAEVRAGDILWHKQRVHGEQPVVPSPPMPHKTNQWVSILQGGAPS